MHNVIMGNLDGNLQRIAFDIRSVRQIISRHKINIVVSVDQAGLLLEQEGEIYPVKDLMPQDPIKPYFILLHSGVAFNVSDYQILFNVKALPDGMLSGLDIEDRLCLCAQYRPGEADQSGAGEASLTELDRRVSAGTISAEEFKNLKETIQKLKQGEFFEGLTMEFTGKIKEIARELVEFRTDIRKRIESDFVEMAAKDIPEASYQLEGINETLEKSTMKIMDINEEQIELANSQHDLLRALILGNGQGTAAGAFWEEGRELTLKIRALLGAMPHEAKEAADFILPNLNLAIEQMSQRGDPERIIEALEEPIGVIKDLVRDCGNSPEQFGRLEELNTGLAELVDRVQQNGKSVSKAPEPENRKAEALRQQMNVLKKISDLSLSMMEPLSFQDLVGQRIQRIIKLVKNMEMRIEDLIVSFGIKFRKHREDPGKSYAELKKDVEKYRLEQRGPRREGLGLKQSDIDDLLETL